MAEPTNQLTLTDAVIRNATLPLGKAQHYLDDDKLPGLALRMRATGGRTWVYLFTKPGVKGTQRKTLGAWPRYNEKAARKAATIAAGEVVKGVDPNETKRQARRQQAAEKQRTTLAILIVEDGPYQTSLTGRQVDNWKPAMSALRRGLKDHAESGVGDLTRRQVMAAVDKIAKTASVAQRRTCASTCTPSSNGALARVMSITMCSLAIASPKKLVRRGSDAERRAAH